MLTEFLTQKSAGPYNPMLAYGYFIFNLYTVPYQSLQQEQVWRHAANQRVGARPAYQFLGAGEQTITLTGTLVPELTGGRVSLELLTKMADTGQAYPLIEGSGVFHGLFVASSISQTRTEFFSDGAARKIEFTVTLTRVDDRDRGLLGVLDVSDLDFGSTLGGLL
jgi:phage protein U